MLFTIFSAVRTFNNCWLIDQIWEYVCNALIKYHVYYIIISFDRIVWLLFCFRFCFFLFFRCCFICCWYFCFFLFIYVFVFLLLWFVCCCGFFFFVFFFLFFLLQLFFLINLFLLFSGVFSWFVCWWCCF